jgi:hypothetical protein
MAVGQVPEKGPPSTVAPPLSSRRMPRNWPSPKASSSTPVNGAPGSVSRRGQMTSRPSTTVQALSRADFGVDDCLMLVVDDKRIARPLQSCDAGGQAARHVFLA